MRAGLEPWTQLLDQITRLQILRDLGRQEEVLREVGRLREQMAGLPEQPRSNERVWPWNVRETLLGAGRSAAVDLERWQESLELLDEVVESDQRRGAGRLEVAGTRFNAYGPLLRLRRLGEAHELLQECQQVYSQENDLRRLGMVSRPGRTWRTNSAARPSPLSLKSALRFKYLASDVATIVVSHHSLANYLGRADRCPDALPHRLAAVLILFQTESGELASTLIALAQDLAETAAPPSFAEVCAAVERVEDVRFRELFAALPRRAASPDDALAQVLALAAQLPNPGPDIEGHLARWQPTINAVVAAIRRVLDGERDEDALAAELDEIDKGHPPPDPRGHRGRGGRVAGQVRRRQLDRDRRPAAR